MSPKREEIHDIRFDVNISLWTQDYGEMKNLFPWISQETKLKNIYIYIFKNILTVTFSVDGVFHSVFRCDKRSKVQSTQLEQISLLVDKCSSRTSLITITPRPGVLIFCLCMEFQKLQKLAVATYTIFVPSIFNAISRRLFCKLILFNQIVMLVSLTDVWDWYTLLEAAFHKVPHNSRILAE